MNSLRDVLDLSKFILFWVLLGLILGIWLGHRADICNEDDVPSQHPGIISACMPMPPIEIHLAMVWSDIRQVEL